MKCRVSGKSIMIALSSAITYGISIPISKMFENDMSPITASALLYLGAGICMLLIHLWDMARSAKPDRGRKLTKHDIPLLVLMLVLNATSGISLLAGIFLTDAASSSLLSNFEVAATAILAFLILKERMGPRMWVAVGAITASSLLLSWDPSTALSFAPGSLLVLLACTLWGFENICTKKLSECDVVNVTCVKGFGTAVACFLIAIAVGSFSVQLGPAVLVVLLGFVSYGISIMLYLTSQRLIGAARTGAYYSAAPFVGMLVSWAIFGFSITATFLPALLLMVLGVAITTYDVMRA